MTPASRREAIVGLVSRAREISVEDLARALAVSRETIRRDLGLLDDDGLIRKFHGGARTPDPAREAPEAEGPFATRMVQNVEAKRAIAALTAQLFRSGDTIFVDTGSTTLAVAEALAGLSHLTVITNSPRIAATIAGNRTNKAFVIGGAFAPDAGETLGALALEQVARFRAQHALLTVGAVDHSCIMDFDVQEAEIARAMIGRSDMVTVVADHSKLGRRAVFEVAPLARIDRLVTDRPPDAAMAEALQRHAVQVIGS
jgi:DeoR family glycerol-3-phosphate regulon repressor